MQSYCFLNTAQWISFTSPGDIPSPSRNPSLDSHNHPSLGPPPLSSPHWTTFAYCAFVLGCA